MRSNQLSYLAALLKSDAKISDYFFSANFLRYFFCIESRKILFAMKNDSTRTLARLFDVGAILASLLLLVSLTLDITLRRSYVLSPGVEELQFIVCMVFIIDFIVQMMVSPTPRRFFWRNVILLIVSLPFLNLCQWGGMELPRGWYIFLKCLPMVRGVVGVYQLVRYLTPTRVSAITWSYVALVILATYLSALIFFAFEEVVNREVTDFGVALWWAGLNVTTVGAPLFAVTPMGKILTVVLPGLGMILFPLFTVYITHLVERTNGHLIRAKKG